MTLTLVAGAQILEATFSEAHGQSIKNGKLALPFSTMKLVSILGLNGTTTASRWTGPISFSRQS